MSQSFNTFDLMKYGFLLIVFLALATVFALFFMQIPRESGLGIDLIFYAVDEWDIEYHVTNGLRNPPWSALLLMPFGSLLPYQAAWGILVFITTIVLILSVPRVRKKWLFWLSVILLMTNFHTLRVFADAQLEVFVISGVLLIVGGYKRRSPLILAIGILLATTKPQAVIILILTLPFFLLQTWKVQDWLKSAAIVFAVVIPTMLWKGAEWIAAVGGTYQAGGIIDSSLRASLNRLGFLSSEVVWILWAALLIATIAIIFFSDRTLSREKAAFMVASSLLLAPYAAGNSTLIVIAVGLVPILQKRFWLGLVLFFIVDAFYPFNNPSGIWIYASYWTMFLLIMWGVCAWWMYQHEMKKAEDAIEPELNPATI